MRNDDGYTFNDWYVASGEPLGDISSSDVPKDEWRVVVDAWSNCVDPSVYGRKTVRQLSRISAYAPTERPGYLTERDFNVPPTMRSPGMVTWDDPWAAYSRLWAKDPVKPGLSDGAKVGLAYAGLGVVVAGAWWLLGDSSPLARK